MTGAPARPGLPDEPIRTARLLIRCWQVDDAPLLKEAIDDSLPDLKPWLPWAVTEPSPVASLAERIGKFRRAFEAGRDWTYGLFSPDGSRVLGGSGLRPCATAERLEIGYWIRSSETGQGLAAEAAGALADFAFRVHGVAAVEIRCDPRNLASAAVPRRLGFRHERTLQGDTTAPDGSCRDTMVWLLERPDAP